MTIQINGAMWRDIRHLIYLCVMPIRKAQDLAIRIALDAVMHSDKYYTLAELISYCNDNVDGGIARTTLRDFFKREIENGSPIEQGTTGKHTSFRLTKKFSFSGLALLPRERATIMSLLVLLDGIGNEQLADSIAKVIDDADTGKGKNDQSLQNRSLALLEFETNFDALGTEHLEGLLQACLKRKAQDIVYKKYDGDEETIYLLPAWLKQYNHRWYLIGRSEQKTGSKLKPINLPLDRILTFTESSTNLQLSDYEVQQFRDLFQDIVGVTLIDENQIEEVRITLPNVRAQYLISRPLHASQSQPIYLANRLVQFKYTLRINPELRNELMRYANDLIDIHPKSLKDAILLQAMHQ